MATNPVNTELVATFLRLETYYSASIKCFCKTLVVLIVLIVLIVAFIIVFVVIVFVIIVLIVFVVLIIVIFHGISPPT